MAISVITYSNLGRKIGVSTPDILPVIKEFSARGKLGQVICYTNRGFFWSRTRSAIPLPAHYFFRILEKYLGLKISRFFYEKIFDLSASLSLKPSEVVLFHGGYFLGRTLKKAQKRGAITIDIPRLAHSKTNFRLEKEELANLGLGRKKRGVYEKILTTYGHLNEFDYIIASSDFVRRSYLDSGYPAERIYLAEFDIDFERFKPNPKPVSDQVFRVLYVAYTNPLKGLHYLLEAWQGLDWPDLELVIVGGLSSLPTELREKYEQMITKNKNIKVVGHMSNPEELYKNSHLFVFPSLTESFGRVTLEAMACGLPVITTENAKGLVEDGVSGFVVPIRNSQAIKEKIEFLYCNKDLTNKMGQEARKAVENKKSFGQRVYEIYQEILEREQKNEVCH